MKCFWIVRCYTDCCFKYYILIWSLLLTQLRTWSLTGDSEVQRTMLELLNQLDGFEPKQNIKVDREFCVLYSVNAFILHIIIFVKRHLLVTNVINQVDEKVT